MKCQVCQQAEAVVHLKQAVNGAVREMHLCQGCAAKNGLEVQAPMGIADLLFGLEIQRPPTPAPPQEACKVCGQKRSDFQKHSRLGCTACYDVFSEDLAPMLADMQKSSSHVGKMPAKAKIGVRLVEMEADLKRAVETEDFERAAELRDRIKTIRNPADGKAQG
jgi:protein arginine kinase activator